MGPIYESACAVHAVLLMDGGIVAPQSPAPSVVTAPSSNSKGRIFLIGASAIELNDLLALLRGLPSAFGGPLLVAVHSFTDRNEGSPLEALAQATTLVCAYAQDGEEITPGRLYLAQPDRHMLVEGNHLRVVFGPKENRHRPALDPLFRTAAVSAGRRTVAVVLCGLTGTIDDGLVGLCVVKERGGTVVVPRRNGVEPGATTRRDVFRRVFADHEPTPKELPGLLRVLADPGATLTL